MAFSSLPIRDTKRYGWVRDSLSALHAPLYDPPTMATLPAHIDLRPLDSPIYDQLTIGSCTGNGSGGVLQFERRSEGLAPDFVPSRLFIYYGARVIEGTANSDAGAQIHDCLTVLERLGAPPETDWTYDIEKFATKPPMEAYAAALKDKVLKASRVTQNINTMKTCLATRHPFVFGFIVYDSFESDEVATTGMVPFPGVNTEAVLGGHCMMAVGYDDDMQSFIVRNSWGVDWGLKGYCMMPYAYLLDHSLSSDFWTIRLVSKSAA